MKKASSDVHKYIAIGLVACSMLMHEILLTRICALRLYFHFAFLVISNCLLGLGASGSLITLGQATFRREPRKYLGWFSALYTLSLAGTYYFLLTYPIPMDLSLSSRRDLFTLTVYNLAGAAPFVFGGTVVGMLLTFDVDRVSKLYAVDLVGAGLGCVLCPFLLPRVGAGGVFLCSALLGLAASVVVLSGRYGLRAIVPGALLGTVGLAYVPSLDRIFPVPSKGFIDFARAVEATQHIAPYSVWTANSRIDLVRLPWTPRTGIVMRGRNMEGLPPDPHAAGIAQDAYAGTTLVDFSGEPAALESLRRGMYSLSYRLKERPKVFIIGLGGGNDAWAAKANGAASIKAIELNFPIVDIHRNVLHDYSRSLVDDPNVTLVVDEGRSRLMRETGKYDVIQMSGIDTWTALASGAYVLAENYLYTPEAIASMYRLLEPGGILQIARFAETMEALRLVSNIDRAFTVLGVPDLERSIAVFATDDKMMAVQVKKGRFSLDEQWNMLHFAEAAGITPLYLPNRPGSSTLETFITSPDKPANVAAFPMNIAPTSDDCPYFFSYTKWQHPFDSVASLGDVPSVSQGNPLFILVQLAASILFSALFIVLPIARRGGPRLAGAWHYLAYFSGLGLGFIFVEIAVIQKLTLFLGQPVYSLTVTLFSLLIFTGLGSLFFADRYEPTDRRAYAVPAALAAYLVLFAVGSPSLVTHLIGLPLAARILVAAALLAPMGLLLGVPFAYGLRVVGAERPELAPWAWAINGSTSVVGSILTVIVSMNFGFRAVLCVAAGIYVAAFAALWRAGARPASAPTSQAS